MKLHYITSVETSTDVIIHIERHYSSFYNRSYKQNSPGRSSEYQATSDIFSRMTLAFVVLTELLVVLRQCAKY